MTNKTNNPAANAAQAERWNGDSARHWIAHRERHVAIRQRLTPHLLRACGIAPGHQVLEIGCGCGETAIAAAHAAGPAGRVRGLDISQPMLTVAQGLAEAAGVANVEFVLGDAQLHPLPRQCYDVAFSSFGILFFDDPAAAFANIVGALKPGGRLAFLSWQSDLDNDLFGIPTGALRAETPLPEEDELFADPEQITGLLAGAGCVNIRVEPVVEPARLGSDVADVLGYVTSMGRFRRLIAELDDPAIAERALTTMAQEYVARERPDGVWITAAAWLTRADQPA